MLDTWAWGQRRPARPVQKRDSVTLQALALAVVLGKPECPELYR